ncbi:capsid portal protein [Vespertilionid gammaherpesvirus 1]|uniref:Capsid portal protein n=1 Tax=Vespertilionid gammaherpesvirus 1 TaxID=2560830 RepID=A0A0X9Y7H2_9GAMA|nr:capsid portal protein [Myotis gammaherpesvirus 8]AMA67399.1 capsid portal protein [Vespertilionid gammaherpesvirus 1]
MFKINPGPGSCMLVHPTKSSVHLFEILQGKYSYVKGQTLHSSLRNPGVFSRQLFVHLYKTALSTCSYDEVISDWQKFENGIKARWDDTMFEKETFKKSTFQSWVETMKMTLDQLLLNNIYHILHTRTNLSYERYVDWVVAVGIVPVFHTKPDSDLVQRMTSKFSESFKFNPNQYKTMKTILTSFTLELTSVIETLTSIYIPDFSEVTIYFNQETTSYYGVYNSKKIDVEIINRPFIFNENITFDSPVQRLCQNIMSCFRTTEHAKLCQLLNTAPMKAIVGNTSTNLYKDILAHLEQSSQKTDPRREMLQLLIKLAENKTVSGVTDVVEDFVTDVSQNIIDKNKIFGTNAESTTQGLKKQVAGSVFKCLTNQINEQFDTIHQLEKERDLFVKKMQLLESHLSHCQNEDKKDVNMQSSLLTSDTLKSLTDISNSSLKLSSSTINKGETVMNSFLTQYVPPFREVTKDLTSLWESEVFETFRLTPVVDNQGQRLYVKYTQDTVSVLLGPFTYIITKLYGMELITDVYSSLSLNEIAECLYKASRLNVYILDVGAKYNPETQDSEAEQNGTSNQYAHWTNNKTL